MRRFLLLGGAVCALMTFNHAAFATILEQYEFQGQTGSQASVAPSFVATGLGGVSFGEVSLTPNSGANSINAAGWNASGAAFTFGFTVNSGYVVSVNQLVLSTRSSGTGPGALSVQASVDGGAYLTVGSFAQTGTAFNDQLLSITPLTNIGSSVAFRIVAANQTSAAGGTIGSAGTFRVADYAPSGTLTPFTINGTLTALTSVPEPASALVLVIGALGAVGMRRRSR